MRAAFSIGFFLVWTLGFVRPASGQTHLGPDLETYQPFDPPARYRAILAAAERCTGKAGNFDEIVWLTAPGRDFWPPLRYYERPGARGASQSLPNIGMWQQASAGRDTIVIASEWRTTDWVVKHELIHFLLQRDHYESKDKDDDVWGRRCQAKWGFLDGSYVSQPGKTYLWPTR